MESNSSVGLIEIGDFGHDFPLSEFQRNYVSMDVWS